jgi:lysozyme family protein
MMTFGYSPAFLRAIEFVLPHEEEFARGHWGDENFVVTENVAGDSGGLTKYGIDASSHPGINIRNLTRFGAIQIYAAEWHKHALDSLPEKIAIACFDVWVNGGHAVAWLQTALNKICGTKLVVDGSLGPATIVAAQTHDLPQVLEYFIQERAARFESIATGSRRKFLAGWKQRDRDLEKFLAG